MRKLIAMTAVLAAVANPSVQAFAGDEGNIGYLSKHTTLEIRIFADMSYIKNESDGVTVDPTGYGFDVKRGYLTLDTDLSEAWSVRFRTDFNYKSAVGETVVYIKNLYVQRDFGNGMKLRIGAADLPWVSYVQNLYRYRYVEKVLVDRVDFGTSADWGLHLLGGADKLNWQVSLVSGAGYKHPLRGRSMDIGA
ncbi:MAG: hypothetical protein L0H12_05275, partial [Nitrosospira sp.]|nr:hypothetical protein [Nitrosospira sp.]